MGIRCLWRVPVLILSGVMIGAHVHQNVSAAAQEGEVGVALSRQLGSNHISCPRNLSFLQPDMEKAIKLIKSARFRRTIQASLQASIPDAIAQADGLPQQIAFLKREIVRHERERARAEKGGSRRTQGVFSTAQALSARQGEQLL